MEKIFYGIVFLLSLTGSSFGQPDANKQIQEGRIVGNVYTSKEIRWAMDIPQGWTITELEKTIEANEKGLKALEETIEGELDYSGLQNLISFQKNNFNIFQSTSEPFEQGIGSRVQNNADLKALIYKAYQNQGIKDLKNRI